MLFLRYNEQMISVHNTRISYITDFFRGMIFHMPVWVAYELQFISLGQLALVEAVMQGSQLLAELPTGAIADLLGKKASVIIGRIIGIFGLFIYSIATSFPVFIVYAIIAGIGESFVSGAYEALMYDSLKQDKKEYLYQKVASRSMMIFQFSFAGAILVGGFLSLIGYKTVIFASILAEFSALTCSLFFQEPYIDTEKFTIPRYVKQLKLGFHELFKSSYVRDISLFYIGVGGITWSAMMIFNTSLLTTIGFSTLAIGFIVAAIRLLNSTILFGALHLKDIVTKKRVYLLFPVIMILCYLPGFALTKFFAIPAVALSTFASSARWIILGSYVNEQYDSKNRATALSTLSMLISLTVVGFAIISNPIMTYVGGVRAMYSVLGFVSVLFILPLGLRIQRRYHM